MASVVLQALCRPLFYGEEVGIWFRLLPYSKEMGHKSSAELLRALNGTGKKTVAPHTSCPHEGCDKGSTNDVVCDVLEDYHVLVLMPIIHGVC